MNDVSHREQHRTAARNMRDMLAITGRRPDGEDYRRVRHVVAARRRAEQLQHSTRARQTVAFAAIAEQARMPSPGLRRLAEMFTGTTRRKVIKNGE